MYGLDNIVKQFWVDEGVGSSKEKSTHLFLKISAVILSVASGYTTYRGFTQYTNVVIASLLTIGVQVLLYASVWRIGSAIKSNNLKLGQVLILLIVMTVSIFFSYSSLLTEIYKKDLQLKDELQSKQFEVVNLIGTLKDSVSQKINLTLLLENFKREIIIWSDSSSQNVAQEIAVLTLELDKTLSKQQRLKQQAELTKNNYAINPDSLNRILYNRYNNRESYNRTAIYNPKLAKYERCKILQWEHDSIFREIVSNNRNISIENIDVLQQKKRELSALVLGAEYASKSIDLPDTLKKQLITISEFNHYYNSIDSLDVLKYNDLGLLKRDALKLVELTPRQAGFNFTPIKNVLLDLDKYTGEDQHQFIAAITLLKNNHILAQGALMIALLIDLLVLCCGIIGALPNSYLTLKSYQEIESVIESSIENVFSMHSGAHEDSVSKRLYLIINQCESSPTKIAYKGYPAVLRAEKIKENGLAMDVGILIATAQARTFDETEDVYIRVRFILWAASKLKS